jgi:hypothetical protein
VGNAWRRCKVGKLDTPVVEEAVGAEQECVGPVTRECGEGGVDFLDRAGFADNDL